MIIGVIGNLGVGKTLCITTLGYLLYMNGYSVYANYHIKFPYKYLDSVEILSSIDKKSSKNVLLLDELWVSADSRHSQLDRNIVISRAIAQSRKKRCIVFYTAQWISQVESRIKTLTNMLLHPRIFLVDKNGVPVVLKISVYYREIMGDLQYIKDIYLNTLGMCSLFDTHEIIEPSKEVKLKNYIEKYNKEKFLRLNKGELYSLILIEEGRNINKAEAQTIVDYIFAKNKVAQ